MFISWALCIPLLLLFRAKKLAQKKRAFTLGFPSLLERETEMKYLSTSLLRQSNFLFMRSFMVLFLISFLAIQLNLCFSNIPSSLTTLTIDGHFSFSDNEFAATDYGNQYQVLPLAVLHPQSVSDIASTIRHIWELGRDSDLTIAARGHGHSINGQALAHRGIIVNMRTLQRPKMRVHTGSSPYVDVSGGELWINILRESLKYGLTPKSWTDYLHLTVGGTLSNAGVSGQAFRHGPQISNVHQLEVVTGKGEVVKCSEQQNTDLFYAVLGGLGQFGIITRARVSLEPAAKMVKWIRVLYTDFATFSRDQESLISAAHTFNYIEGFVIKNRKDLLNSWRSSFNPEDAFQASQFKSEGRTLFCLELAKYFNPAETNIYQEIENLMSKLSYIPSTHFHSEVPYKEFLDRVHASELKLRSKGMWDIPHPWLNLLIPKSKIGDFAQEVFGNILTDTNTGPVLVYPVHKSRWDNRTSAVLPEEDIFYLVGLLSHAVSSSTGTDGLEHMLTRNKRILDFCEAAHLGVKQYLPHYTSQDDWRTHFGPRWEVLAQRKSAYDPHAILAPGQRIFQKRVSYL